MLSETDEFAELFKGCFPYYILFFIHLFIIISPVSANHEFPAYRLTEYDLNGVPHGCRASLINLEARGIRHSASQRHCVIVKLTQLTVSELARIKENAGGLLIVLPHESEFPPPNIKEAIREVELYLLEDKLSIPVYFIHPSIEVENVLRNIENSDITDGMESSTLEAIVNAISSNGYQVVINNHKPVAKTDAAIISIQGKLSGYGVEDKLPTVAIVTHYDAFSVAPELPANGDSNSSGVIMFLELVRIFSNLYSNVRTHAPVNILFLLAGGGKFNYQGSKKWLEDQLDGLEGSLLQDAMFVLCLDTVGFGNELFLHVSKPPKEGSVANHFYEELRLVTNDSISLLHKKINLADEVFAWEHERYSMRRLSAFTFSSVKNFRDPVRKTSFDVSSFNVNKLSNNIYVVASALARVIYNVSSGRQHFALPTVIEPDIVKAWSETLSSLPRSAIVLNEKSNPLVKMLHDYLSRYLKGTKLSVNTADKRDPEFVFYDTTKTIVNLYNVKHAVFDLFVSVVVACYLVVFYFFINKFDTIYSLFYPSTEKKIKHH